MGNLQNSNDDSYTKIKMASTAGFWKGKIQFKFVTYVENQLLYNKLPHMMGNEVLHY